MSTVSPPPASFYRPLFPEDTDQGDPYILAVPTERGARFNFYVYSTGEDPVDGMAFPVYGSDDLRNWQRLGMALRVERQSAHWAPCVRYVPALARPYVMLYSRAIGVGEQAHVGHVIRRADSLRPEGPFRDSGHALTPDLDFAIDPDVYRLPDGSLKLAFAMDFVAGEPYGTGIVETDISDDLASLASVPRLLARPRHDWHLFEPARAMPWKMIPGVDWSRQTVRWHTVEAPVGGLVSPLGTAAYLYSGGCFYRDYAVGALVADEQGRLRDVSEDVQTVVIGPRPEEGFFAPGHCSWLRDDGEDYLLLHARFGSHEAKRQMCLARLTWTEDTLPVATPIG